MKKDYLKPSAELVNFYADEEITERAPEGDQDEQSIPEGWE